MKIIYPAIFHREEGSYWVEFPDLEGCQSFGDTLEETLENAKEALAAYYVTLMEQGKQVKSPRDILGLKAAKNEFVSLVEANLIEKSKAVKKTLTIPSWLNEKALEKNINFSQTLQEALQERLGL
ncbi:MAG: HicB family protein [Clostridiales bacterium]|nr:HicB family protein [Clostridiales bacterium]